MPEDELHTESDAADRPVEDCRSHERHLCEMPGTCRPLSTWSQADAKWNATIVNISLGGLCVRVPRRFEPGVSLAVGFDGPSGDASGLIFVRVIYNRPAADGAWDLGCQFVNELSEEELFRLVDASTVPGSAAPLVQPVAPSHLLDEEAPEMADAANQRAHDRHPPADHSILHLAIRPAFGGLPAVLADVSAGGLGLVLDRRLEEGAVLAIDMRGPDGEGTRRIARVRHCRPCAQPADAPWVSPVPLVTRFARFIFGTKPPPPAEAWMIGCQFTRPLDDDELNELLGLLNQGH
jgi:hypothetical protein